MKLIHFERPGWADKKIWRNWRRCVRRGYRKPTEQDFKEYHETFGENPRQNKEMQTVTRIDTVAVTKVAATPHQMGRKAFNEFKARILAGRSDPRFSVLNDTIVFLVKVRRVVAERRAK